MNENRNGVVRKVLPKDSPFDAILDEEMRRIDRMLNDPPHGAVLTAASGRRRRG